MLIEIEGEGTFYIVVREGKVIKRVEVAEGVTADYGEGGRLVGVDVNGPWKWMVPDVLEVKGQVAVIDLLEAAMLWGVVLWAIGRGCNGAWELGLFIAWAGVTVHRTKKILEGV